MESTGYSVLQHVLQTPLVDLTTLAIISRTLRASEIADALAWIEANRAYCVQVFKECNP
jgi:hypothetical protein